MPFKRFKGFFTTLTLIEPLSLSTSQIRKSPSSMPSSLLTRAGMVVNPFLDTLEQALKPSPGACYLLMAINSFSLLRNECLLGNRRL